mmetsp:Transcript_21123/g.60296  ORF Transcript_21123/g.60296 Transcript_21123/m.60296 type:complete len:119 (-) Transcript_21123:1590-1946(-)
MMTMNEGQESGVACHPPSSSIMMRLHHPPSIMPSIGTGAAPASFHQAQRHDEDGSKDGNLHDGRTSIFRVVQIVIDGWTATSIGAFSINPRRFQHATRSCFGSTALTTTMYPSFQQQE